MTRGTRLQLLVFLIISVLGTIERHSAKVANSSWWGDNYWKTTRNRDAWGGAGTVAQK